MPLLLFGTNLQRFALKPEPRNFLEVLQSNTSKKFLLVSLIRNCCKDRALAKFLVYSSSFSGCSKYRQISLIFMR